MDISLSSFAPENLVSRDGTQPGKVANHPRGQLDRVNFPVPVRA